MLNAMPAMNINYTQIDTDNTTALESVQTKPEYALEIAQRTCQLAMQMGYNKGIADSLLVQGIAQFYYANYETALSHLGKALAVYDNLQDHAKSARALHTMGITFRQIGDFSSALDVFSKALSLSKQVGNILEEIRALNGLASIYGSSHQHGVSINYLHEALLLAQKWGYASQEATILGNLCHQANEQGQYDVALQYGLQSWAIYQQMKDMPISVINVCIRLSQVYDELKQYQQAVRFANQALALAYAFKAPNDVVAGLSRLGAIYADLGREEEALVYVKEALATAQKYDIEMSNYMVYFFASRLYKNRGEYQEALEALERYHDLRLALFSEESEAKMHQLEARYKVEAARQEAEFYQMRNQELEQLRLQDQQYYARLTSMKDKFIREASHDLKNPLAIILLNVSLVQRALHKDPAKALSALEQIRQQTLRSKDLVTELLDLAWLETGRAIDGKPVHLMTLVKRITEDMQSLATEKNIGLSFVSFIPESSTIMGDEKQLTRVMENLLSNAIKYTPNGGTVVVDMKLESAETGQDVVVRVKDTGIGLTEQQLELVFEPFYKAHDEMESDSTGLGLTIVQTIIKQHGGTMLVESASGQGSTFGFRLALISAINTP
jgi:signal transduction histidine kinase